jgi:hypothetical protein
MQKLEKSVKNEITKNKVENPYWDYFVADDKSLTVVIVDRPKPKKPSN